MAMGKRKRRQESLWVAAAELPTSPGHPFYQKLNAILDAAGFDAFVENVGRDLLSCGCAPPTETNYALIRERWSG